MIEREDRGSVAVLRLAHGKASAMDTSFCLALADEIRRVETDAMPLVITGTGSIFSAGVDLEQLCAADDDQTVAFLRALDHSFEALFRFPLPAVAAVNGHAIAGGHVLAACCDYRIMARGKGRIGVPELRVGVPFPPVALEAIRCALPAHDHADAILIGTTATADEAKTRCWVHEVAEPDALVERAVAVAAAMAATPEVSFRLTKALLRAPSIERIEHERPRFESEVATAWCSNPVRSAVRCYLERTLRGA